MSKYQNWGCCMNDNASDEKFVRCDKCRTSFHLACMSITDIPRDSSGSLNWNCPKCAAFVQKNKEDHTLLRNVSGNRGSKRPAMNSPSPPAVASVTEDLKSTIQEVVRAEFSNMLIKFNDNLQFAINKELMPIKEEMKEISDSMSFINQKFEEIKKEQETSAKSQKELQAENMKLKETVGNLSTRIDYLEQQARSSNLEIQCVPEKKGENLGNIILQLGKAVNYELKSTDILHFTRSVKINPTSTRPRSIVIQLASPKMRDELLSSAIKFNKSNPQERLCSTHLGIPGPKLPVYVVEHLSPSNKILHAATRVKAKDKGYKYVWIRNGRIFARKTETSEYILIKNMDTLNRLI